MIAGRARRLRELTEKHYHGLIDSAAYRAERARLLDGLSGLSDDDDTDTLEAPRQAPASAPRAAQTASVGATPGASRPRQPRPFLDRRQQPSAPSRRALWWAVGMVTVTVAALGAWLLLPPGPERAAEPAAAQPAPAPAAPDSLIDDFLALESWDEQAVSRFLFQWDDLSPARRAGLRNTETFRRFVGEVRRRIMVDRAVGAPAFRGGLSLTEALSVELDMGLVSADAGTPGNDASPDPVAGKRAPAAAQSERTFEPAAPEAAAADGGPADEGKNALVEAGSEDARIPDAGSSDAGSADTAAATDEAISSAAVSEQVPRLESDQPCSADRLNVRSATCWDLLAEDVRAPLLRVVPAGSFLMGDAEDASASPPHEQVIERPFAIGMFEVSHDQYLRFCRATGHRCPARRWASGEHPVVDVTWQDAQAYVSWLSGRTGASYRLPTEAEWEYAARAGSTERYPFGDEIDPTFARYDSGVGHGGALPASDRTTRRNGYRLMHMAGNVRELTAESWRDDYDAPPDDARVAVRGGSYADRAERLRSAAREGISRTGADSRTGFRVVRDL